MAQTKAIVDMLLTNVSSMFVPKGYISESLLPFIAVKEKTGKLAKYGNNHLRIETSIIGGRGKYRRVEPITRSQSTYSVDGHGLEGLVTKDDYRNVQQPYDAEADETVGLTSQLWVEKEVVLATAFADTAVMTQNTTLSGTTQFSDYENSDPISVCGTARSTIRTGCGEVPNAMWCSWYVKNKLRYHPMLLDLLGYKFARPGGLNDDELARALDVEKVLIANVTYNSAKEGQTDSLADAWGKHIWFGVLPNAAAVRQVSLGYRLGMIGSSPRQVYKESVFNPPGSTSILVEDEYSFFLSNVAAGYLIKDAVA